MIYADAVSDIYTIQLVGDFSSPPKSLLSMDLAYLARFLLLILCPAMFGYLAGDCAYLKVVGERVGESGEETGYV